MSPCFVLVHCFEHTSGEGLGTLVAGSYYQSLRGGDWRRVKRDSVRTGMKWTVLLVQQRPSMTSIQTDQSQVKDVH